MRTKQMKKITLFLLVFVLGLVTFANAKNVHAITLDSDRIHVFRINEVGVPGTGDDIYYFDVLVGDKNLNINANTDVSIYFKTDNQEYGGYVHRTQITTDSLYTYINTDTYLDIGTYKFYVNTSASSLFFNGIDSNSNALDLAVGDVIILQFESNDKSISIAGSDYDFGGSDARLNINIGTQTVTSQFRQSYMLPSTPTDYSLVNALLFNEYDIIQFNDTYRDGTSFTTGKLTIYSKNSDLIPYQIIEDLSYIYIKYDLLNGVIEQKFYFYDKNNQIIQVSYNQNPSDYIMIMHGFNEDLGHFNYFDLQFGVYREVYNPELDISVAYDRGYRDGRNEWGYNDLNLGWLSAYEYGDLQYTNALINTRTIYGYYTSLAGGGLRWVSAEEWGSIRFQNGLNSTANEAYDQGYIDGSNDSFMASIKDWIVPAIIVVLFLGGALTIIAKKREG